MQNVFIIKMISISDSNSDSHPIQKISAVKIGLTYTYMNDLRGLGFYENNGINNRAQVYKNSTYATHGLLRNYLTTDCYCLILAHKFTGEYIWTREYTFKDTECTIAEVLDRLEKENYKLYKPPVSSYFNNKRN